MMKNLKRLALSIFIFIFSLVSTFNVLTSASAPKYPCEKYVDDSMESSEDEDNFDSAFLSGSKREYGEEFNESDSEENYEEEFNESDNYEDFENEKAYNTKIRFLKKSRDKKKNAKKKKELNPTSGKFDRMVLKKLHSLCKQIKDDESEIPTDPLAQYTLVCQNFFKLSNYEKNYTEICQILNGFAMIYFDRNFMEPLALKDYEKPMVSYLYNSAFDILAIGDLYYTPKTLNFLDAIYIYSCIFCTEGDCPNLEIMKKVLIHNRIDPETFTPFN